MTTAYRDFSEPRQNAMALLRYLPPRDRGQVLGCRPVCTSNAISIPVEPVGIGEIGAEHRLRLRLRRKIVAIVGIALAQIVRRLDGGNSGCRRSRRWYRNRCRRGGWRNGRGQRGGRNRNWRHRRSRQAGYHRCRRRGGSRRWWLPQTDECYEAPSQRGECRRAAERRCPAGRTHADHHRRGAAGATAACCRGVSAAIASRSLTKAAMLA